MKGRDIECEVRGAATLPKSVGHSTLRFRASFVDTALILTATPRTNRTEAFEHDRLAIATDARVNQPCSLLSDYEILEGG